ncbi:MAG TPA: hypothetical protein VF559_08115 [Caulobacteraceae bacterium]|jgi:hypothetical protein
MIALLLAAAALTTGDRPPELLGDKPQPEYLDWLKAETIRREPASSAQPSCSTAKAEPIGWRAGPMTQEDETLAKGPSAYEKLRFSGCGRASVQNLLVARLKDGGWRATSLAPGDSRADVVLQTDVAKVWFPAVRNKAPQACQGEEWMRWFRRGEARVEKEPDPETGEWVEVWPAALCGEDRSIRLTFRPTKENGGAEFRMEPLAKPG